MGMDVHGLNPKENKTYDDFPVLKEMESIGFNKKWEILDADEEKREAYWKQKDEFAEANPGVYFRNNCWWWRPLWNYCYAIADDIISEEVWDSGHSNNGAGLNAEDAERLGKRMLNHIDTGECIKYQAEYMQYIEEQDDEFAKSYPFDVDNVREFANFCIESGGFEIC